MITVTFRCGGCDAKAQGTAPLSREFVSFSGRSHGIGGYHWNTVADVTPEGWTASDRIGATYCPACTKSLEEPTQPTRGV